MRRGVMWAAVLFVALVFVYRVWGFEGLASWVRWGVPPSE